MATIGNLSVSLTALTGKFTAGMRGASRTLDTFGARVKTIGAALTSTRALMTGLATGAAVMMTKRLADNIDATAKLADSLGTTTEALIGLRHGANLAGASAEVLEGALSQLQKRIGTGAAAKALERIGLGGNALSGKGPAAQFSMIADGIKKLSTAEARAAVVTELFGRSGQQLLPLLSEGSAGLRAYTEDAKKLGIAFSRVDAAKVEMANDAITRTGEALKGGLQSAIIQLAPYVETVANKMTDWLTSGEGVSGLAKSGFGGMAGALDTIAGKVDTVAGSYSTLQERMSNVIATGIEMTGELADGVQAHYSRMASFIMRPFTLMKDSAQRGLSGYAMGAAGSAGKGAWGRYSSMLMPNIIGRAARGVANASPFSAKGAAGLTTPGLLARFFPTERLKNFTAGTPLGRALGWAKDAPGRISNAVSANGGGGPSAVGDLLRRAAGGLRGVQEDAQGRAQAQLTAKVLGNLSDTLAGFRDRIGDRMRVAGINGLKDMGRRFVDVAGSVLQGAIDNSGVLRGNPGFDDIARWRGIGTGMGNQQVTPMVRDSIATAAGSAGTFGSLGGRLVGAQTMVQRQTELLERIADSSETTADAIGSGIPLPEGP